MSTRKMNVKLTEKLCSSDSTDGPVGSRKSSDREVDKEDKCIGIYEIIGLALIEGTTKRRDGVDVWVRIRRAAFEADCLSVVY